MADLVVVIGEWLAQEAIQAVLGLGWRKYNDTERCPACNSGPLFVRTVGVLWGRHNQVVCPHHQHIIGEGPNRCAWSRDEDN